ncbi:MAG: carbohydrate ABC transporter permease [Lachnospiraceae bacterium]|nr:carbohydrate ABC transporter permease [Lachnospiraceae bacterium]
MGRIWKFFIYILLFALAAIICFPVVFMFVGALMQDWELTEYLGPVLGNAEGMASWSFLPRAPTLEPVVELLLDSPQYFVMFWNSMKLSLCILAGQLLFGMPSAWALARYSFPGRKFLLLLYIVLMLMPFQVLMLPEYLVLNRLGLIDTHLAVILPSAFSTFPVFIMYRFFRGIPETLLEAAQIDGAGELQVFGQIGVPLGSAGVVSAAILGFLESWNMIEQPMTFLKTESLWPLSLFLPDIGLTEAGMGFAAAVFMLVPALLVFLCGQDYLEQGIAAAALKE